MSEKIKYYVSYVMKEPEHLSFGIGSCILIRNKKITTLEDVKEIENYIQQQNNFKNRITLISWEKIDND